jgi:hypothetical protein
MLAGGVVDVNAALDEAPLLDADPTTASIGLTAPTMALVPVLELRAAPKVKGGCDVTVGAFMLGGAAS